VTSGFISDETLLGYLLGALEDSEHAVVRDALLRDKHLQVRLRALQAMSGPMLGEDEIYEPPGAMVSRLMCDVEAVEEEAPRGCRSDDSDDIDSKPDNAVVTSAPHPLQAFAGKSTWIDLGMSLTAAAIGFCLVAPAVLQTRETARASQCASGLMTLGLQIRDFAFKHRYSRVPEVEAEGPLAFAGVYAIRLNDADLLDETQSLWCPSSGDARLSEVGIGERRFPSADELKRLPGSKRRVWQHIVGGSYAYNLGVIINNQHTMPSLEDASDVAILADAPGMPDERKLVFTAHRGVASNVLYRDGRVQLLRMNRRYDGPDHPYLNRNGVIQAGVDVGDSALGASYQPPLGPVR
jgi:hypothetical protein